VSSWRYLTVKGFRPSPILAEYERNAAWEREYVRLTMGTPARRTLDRDGVALSALDYGGGGLPVVLLHGLAGHALEWADTASWLQASHRVVALDLRGHGNSMQRPPSVGIAPLVADVVAWLDELELERVALVGQSFGGHIAFLVAASYPERLARLVVAEASPSRDLEAEQAVRTWLESWPIPFQDHQAAIRFFGGESLWARAWSSGLERRADGLWPRFDLDTLARMLREGASRDHWDAWQSIRCPTLIVRGERGIGEEDVACMVAKLAKVAVTATVRDAGHDVHLEQPQQWRNVVEPFLAFT
jgi:pimeloyl-ACP methyl ester carboxylesterase